MEKEETKQKILMILKELKTLGRCDNPELLVENFMFNFDKGFSPEKTIQNLTAILEVERTKRDDLPWVVLKDLPTTDGTS